ncbi:thioredoxin [Fibrobacteres bacterium R8-0-B4]
MNKKIVLAALIFFCAFAQLACAQDGKKARADSSQQIADRITASKIPVVVDFWAAWCGPCRYLDPIIEELQKEYKGRVLFIKVDVDVHLALTAYFTVSAVPTVYVIEDKTVRSAMPGVRYKKEYVNAIESALKLSKDRQQPKKPDIKPDTQKCALNC